MIFISSYTAMIQVNLLDVVLEQDLLEFEFLQKYIPHVQIMEGKQEIDCSLTFICGDKNYMHIQNYPNCTFSYTNQLNLFDAVTAIEYILERARQEKDILCMHCSTVSVRNGGVIIWGGASGMGKTRLALQLADQPECSLFGDEKVLIDMQDNTLIRGVHYLYLEKSFYKDVDKDEYKYKKFDQNIFGALPISLFIYPFVEEVEDKLICEPFESKKFEWHLYEEFCRKIRGGSRRFSNGSVSVESIDSTDLANKRIQWVKKISSQFSCIYLKGGQKTISSKVLELLK